MRNENATFSEGAESEPELTHSASAEEESAENIFGIESGEVDLEMAGVEVLPGDEEGADVAPDDTSVAEIDVELELTTTPEEMRLNAFVNTLVSFLTFIQLKFGLPDRGLQSLLYLVAFVIETIYALIPSNHILRSLRDKIPTSLYSLRKRAMLPNAGIRQYCVCPKCDTLYSGGNHTIQTCTYIQFPNHPHKSRKAACNASLLKTIKSSSSYKLLPRKLYSYNCIIENVKRLMSRPGFMQLCRAWNDRTVSSGVLTDIYDGGLWNDFRNFQERPFLNFPHNLAFLLNVDWFQPFDHVQYSVGVLYLTILNLPRSQRYLLENVIVVGCIPGPSEPHNLNPYLEPLVEDLLTLWDGVVFKPESYPFPVVIRACLLGVACDLPATRKVCGFTGHTSTQGCSKCMKTFKCNSFGEKLDYSGFNRETWIPRTQVMHNEAVNALGKATCLSQQERIEKMYGVRISALVKLPYFNIIRQHVVDAMHNLYLGTAKHMITIWKEMGLLTSNELDIIQNRVDEMDVPHGIGRIPNKISSKFSSLTADQWRNWTNIYSLYALHNILPSEHYSCWSIFVEASIILSQYSISKEDLKKADEKLILFCQTFETLYGSQSCTPNMHLHCHIKECVLDFGPISSFWVFPFERFNGIMQSFLNNWVSPELQMMKKFISYQNVISFPTSTSAKLDYIQFDEGSSLFGEGSLVQTATDGYERQIYAQNYICPLNSINAVQLKFHTIGPRIFENYFSDDEVKNITNVYSWLYPQFISHPLFVCRTHLQFYDLHAHGEHLISIRARSMRSCTIMAIFPKLGGTIDPEQKVLRFGEVQFFIQHSIQLPNTAITTVHSQTKHLFAKVKWFCQHPGENTVSWPLKIVATDFEPEGPSTFIPVSRIICRCAIAKKQPIAFDCGHDVVNIVCPLFTTVVQL